MTSYEGQCHCGAIQFRLSCGSIQEGLRCNCSVCVKRGALMSVPYFAPEEFQVTRGESDTEIYRWGDQLVDFRFCGHCGVHVFHEALDRPGHYRVNLACLNGLDLAGIEVGLIDGRSF